MKQLVLLIPLVIGAALMLTQCGREAVSNNSMEEIYAEEGVPVRARVVEPKLFETSLSYHAALNGIEESSVYAMISDEVEEIAVEVGDFVEKDQLLLRFPKTTPSARYEQAKEWFRKTRRLPMRMPSSPTSGSSSCTETGALRSRTGTTRRPPMMWRGRTGNRCGTWWTSALR